MSNQKLKLSVLAAMVFFGALLLFGMEPLIGRLLTPFLGGAAHVWLTCLMFFQAMLFIGYLYAHLFARRIGAWHLVLLAFPLVNIPLSVNTTLDPIAPLSNLLITLLLHAALPFTVLATTAVVAQSWFSNSSIGKNSEPYPLYAVSNAGSLIALIGYTFLAEPFLGLRMQSLIWSATYLIYAFLVVAAWYMLRPQTGYYESNALTSEKVEKSHWKSISGTTYCKWLLLSSLPSGFLLALTNFIALEVGSFPLIWIAPLALYLMSFIVTFRKSGGVPKYLNILWPEIILIALLFYFLGPAYWPLIFGHLLIFLVICLVSHGTLYELRPSANHLTNYYLVTALGGWLGGAFVSLLAPHLFRGLYEYPLLLLLLGLTFLWCHTGAFKTFQPGTSLPIFCSRVAIVAILVSLIGVAIWPSATNNVRFRYRNFYGTYRIVDVQPAGEHAEGMRQLLHGRTAHGGQLLNASLQTTPVLYYYRGGPIADVLEATSLPKKVAIIGLGSGAAAAFSKSQDIIDYYEIDPDNEWIARNWFTYLNDSKGQLKIIVGDGRLSLQKQEGKGKKYDIIFIDAFTGDGIPTHLLTTEALEIYLDRLAENGIILFHVSNRFYELRPVIKAIGTQLHLYGAVNFPAARNQLKAYQSPAKCVVLTRNPRNLRQLLNRGWQPFGRDDGLRDTLPWTDDYTSVFFPLVEKIRMEVGI